MEHAPKDVLEILLNILIIYYFKYLSGCGQGENSRGEVRVSAFGFSCLPRTVPPRRGWALDFSPALDRVCLLEPMVRAVERKGSANLQALVSSVPATMNAGPEVLRMDRLPSALTCSLPGELQPKKRSPALFASAVRIQCYSSCDFGRSGIFSEPDPFSPPGLSVA
jgi:hypothetical protein